MNESNGPGEGQTVPRSPQLTAPHIPSDEPTDSVRTRPHGAPDGDTGHGSRPSSRGGTALPEPPPGYELLAELGRGGMGVVYRARQTNLHREVALKTILNAATADRVSIARFWAEAEVMAAVKHPHVVQVYELGEHAGTPFLAMEYLTGGSLADRIEGHTKLDPRTAAALLAQIARGVAAAHDLGIVHRDLKPANVLFQVEGPKVESRKVEDTGSSTLRLSTFRLSDLLPKVTDFGLAKRGASDLTHTNAVMGTPAYMAPEQARGEAKFVGPPADVWALGVILYECIAGERPFVGSTPEVLSRVTSKEPPALRTRVSWLPRAIDTIVTKCLAKEPERRYPNAAALADDLERFVRGEPITARAAGRVERTVMWARRNPTRAGLYVAVVAASLLLLVGSAITKLWIDAKRARDTAKSAQTDAENAQAGADQAKLEAQASEKRVGSLHDALKRSEAVRAVDLAYREYLANNIGHALALLDSCPPELRGWEWHYVHRLCHSHVLTLKGHTGRITQARYSPDGTRIVTASTDGTAKLWNAATGKELFALKEHTGPVWFAEFSADGSRLLTAGDDHTPIVWNTATGAPVCALKGHTGAITSARFVFFNVITTSTDRTARTWNPANGQQLRSDDGGGLEERRELRARVESLKTNRLVHLMTLREGAPPLAIEHIRDRVSEKPVVKLEAPVRGESAAFSADGSTVVIGTHDREAVLFDAVSGKVIARTRGHTGPVTAVGLNPDATRFVTGSLDSTVRVWDLARLEPAWAGTEGIKEPLHHCAFSADGTKIAMTDMKNRLIVRDTATGATETYSVPGTVSTVTWSPAGVRVATTIGAPAAKGVAAQRRLVFWNPVTGEEVGTHGPNRVDPTGTHANRTGTHFATAFRDKAVVVRVWDASTGAETGSVTVGIVCNNAVVNDAGTRIAVANGSAVEVWDVPSRTRLYHVEGRAWNALVLDGFTADNRLLCRNQTDRLTVLYDIEKGEPEITVGGHGGFPVAAALSPDGTRLVTADDSETVKVWDRRTGQELLALRLPHPVAMRMMFTPDGLTLVAMQGIPSRPFVVWDAVPVNPEFPRPTFGTK